MPERTLGRLQCAGSVCHATADPRGWSAMTGGMYCAMCAYEIEKWSPGTFPLIGLPLRGSMPHGTSVRIFADQLDTQSSAETGEEPT